MDFYVIKERSTKNGVIEIYPDFKVGRSTDLMVRGKSFYAVWNEEQKMWSTDEYDVQALVDKELLEYKDKAVSKSDGTVHAKLMGDFSTNSWANFRNYLSHISDNAHQLDEKLSFADTELKKKDYASKRLPYSVKEGPTDAYDELLATLYDPEERAKIEWAIGAILAGDGKDIQKFLVLYGDAGGGKSTVLNIIQKLFAGYYTTFEAKALTSSTNSFSTEAFRGNPLVAIQHDGDLSRIDDNTKLNSIVSHEEMTMNEKYKPSYTAKVNCFLFMASNQPVKITDAKAGIIRRLINVNTSGRRVPTRRYLELVSQVEFELGAIAFHCLSVYREMGKHYYASYIPLDMMFKTDSFFNFVESELYGIVSDTVGISLSQAYDMYKKYCEDSELQYKLPRYKFRDELKNYFLEYYDVTRIEGKQIRSYFLGLKKEKFVNGKQTPEAKPNSLVMDKTVSLLDDILANELAQYASNDETGIPTTKWINVSTTLSSIDTKKLHYVKVPLNHIVIDFDITDDTGNKSASLNIEAASLWPPTYSEYSKSKKGIHLHYLYTGDTDKLSGIYSEGIEVKVFRGDASLRRKLSYCNNLPIASLSGGLPLKEEKMINSSVIKSEKGIRRLIERNLQKEIHGATKPSIDFIHTILEEAYKSGIPYDVTNLRNKIIVFANNSTNNAKYCLQVVASMKFQSEEPSVGDEYDSDDAIVFFDIEVFPNLLLISWKFEGEDKEIVHMFNPTPQEIESLLGMKLVGFNCRRYDNHILYAGYLGYNNLEIYNVSQKIIDNSRNAFFREAYTISYTDVYDFSSVKQSLKLWEIDLNLKHIEFNQPWDKPLDEKLWISASEYCGNDVLATEAVFNHRKPDFVARQILAELSGLTVNDTTNAHTTKIVFGDDYNVTDKLVYTDLSTIFPGYVYDFGKSTYRGEEVGEGGYVYAEPGIYQDVALLDIASMHPTSIEILNLLGPYTKKYSQLKDARLAVKHKNYDAARSMLNGKISKYLTSEENSEALAYALKLAINSAYGLTFASFENKFRDPRNKDNIVAKIGALFMVDLKHAVQEQGFTVAHCKTDSIKIPNATKEIIDFVIEYGRKFGYSFEHEATYSKFCLVNNAVYIARIRDGKKKGQWTATGAQFAHPYVFKTLFSNEEILFQDLCETKSVSGQSYMALNMSSEGETPNYQFVGKVGQFCPVTIGTGGGTLHRIHEDKITSVSGTKGYIWLESSVVKALPKEDWSCIDMSYFEALKKKAISKIEEFGSYDDLVS